MVKWQEERGYMAGRKQLYSRRSAVIWQEEGGYISRICNKNSGLPKFALLSHPLRSDQLYSRTLLKIDIYFEPKTHVHSKSLKMKNSSEFPTPVVYYQFQEVQLMILIC